MSALHRAPAAICFPCVRGYRVQRDTSPPALQLDNPAIFPQRYGGSFPPTFAATVSAC